MPTNLSDLPRIIPTKLALRKQPFDSPDWLFELKHDGFRCLVYVADGECKLVSRNRNVFKTFKRLQDAIPQTLKVRDCILDGELICIHGRSVFNTLLRRRSEPVFYAFDLLWLNGIDLRKNPLVDRKRQLRKLILKDNPYVLYASHIEGDGKGLFEIICAQDLEGIVAKRKNAMYSEHGWLKIKNPSYSQRLGRKEKFDSYRDRGRG
jgi:bifunctional non-homologous end joining protein LigD